MWTVGGGLVHNKCKFGNGRVKLEMVDRIVGIVKWMKVYEGQNYGIYIYKGDLFIASGQKLEMGVG